MNRYHIVASISIFGLGLSMPVLAADTAKPASEAPSTQSGQPDSTSGQGQTGQMDAAQSDTSKPKSDQPDAQAGHIESTTGQGQTGQDSSQAGANKPKEGQATSQSNPSSAQAGTPEAMFMRIDGDSDGVITKVEADSDATVKKAWTTLDKDKDGKVSRADFLGYKWK